MKKIVLMSLMASLPFTVISQAHAANTQEFVQKASMAGEFEIQSSKVALDKSTSSDVKDFAQGMITDHTDASKKLEEAVKDAQLDPNLIKTSVDEKHKEMISNLSDAPADKFNKKYTDMQLDAHKEAVELLEDYSNNGDNQILKDFASKTLPTLQAHLSHVKELEAKIK